MEKQLCDLSIVLGAMNDINKEMIESNANAIKMLREQQRRQTAIIIAAFFIVSCALYIVWRNTERTFDAVEVLSQQVQYNTEIIRNGQYTQDSTRLHSESRQE